MGATLSGGPLSWRLHSGGAHSEELHFGGLESRESDFGFGSEFTRHSGGYALGATLWEATLSGGRLSGSYTLGVTIPGAYT